MGKVYKALDTRLDRVVAIKLSAERFGERFEREARAVASLNHPYIFGETGRRLIAGGREAVARQVA